MIVDIGRNAPRVIIRLRCTSGSAVRSVWMSSNCILLFGHYEAHWLTLFSHEIFFSENHSYIVSRDHDIGRFWSPYPSKVLSCSKTRYSSRGRRVANLYFHCNLRSTYPQFYFRCNKPIYDSTISLSNNLFAFSLKFSDGYGDQYPPQFLIGNFRHRFGFVLVTLPHHSDIQNNSRVGR